MKMQNAQRRTHRNRFARFVCLILLVSLLPGGSLPGQDEAGVIKDVPGNPGKLSLEIKGMDILDVLRLLSTKSGLSIVAGANVRGRVTLFLKEVNPWDAFVIILETNNLAYEVRGDIIKVMTDRDYELLYGEKFQNKTIAKMVQVHHAKVADIATSLNQVKTRIGTVIADARSNTLILVDIPERVEKMARMIAQMDVSTETRVYGLDYGVVEEVVPEIEKVLTPNVGRIESDDRTNKLAVTDLPEQFAVIEQLIEAFDEKTPEVLIVAKIVEVTLSDDYAFGIDWSIFTEILRNALNPGTPFVRSNLDVNAISSASSGVSTLTFSRGDVSTVVEALKTFGQTNTLSSPRLLVANNEEARILIGTDEAFVTQQTVVSSGGSNTSDEVQFVEVGTKLAVTPTINRKGFVKIKIKPEVSSVSRTLVVGASNTTSNTTAQQTARTTIPIVSTSEAETTVLVKDGNTVVIGGLIKDSENMDFQEIPFLGSLPFLGGLFRSEDHEIDKTELMIFVTPYIVTGEEDVLGIQEVQISAEDEADLRLKSEWHSEKNIPSFEKSVQPFIQPNISGHATVEPVSYRDILRGQILKSLSKLLPQARRVGEVHLSFALTQKGELLGSPVITSRRNELLDPLVLQSVRDSTPFPPFPDSITTKEETFNLAIAFE